VARAAVAEDEVLFADCDLSALEATRRIWPFFRDRRIDSFEGLTKRMIDG